MSLQTQAYISETAEARSVICQLNKTIETLKEQLANSHPKNPNNFEDWRVVRSACESDIPARYGTGADTRYAP